MRAGLRGRFAATLVASFLAAAVAPPAAAAAEVADSATTVILVRHTEKNAHPPGGDAGLNTKGLLRARELARVVADARLAAVYVSQYGRARQSGEPAAESLGDSVRVYDANRNDLLADRIRREHRGQAVLVVGHSDSVPELYQALTGARLPTGEGVPYDRLYVVTLPGDGSHTLLRLRYGARTE